MDLETLDGIFKANNDLILRRAGLAGVKAVSFGSESLDDLITRIADAYGLDEADRAAVYPFRAGAAGDEAVPAVAASPALMQAGKALLASGVKVAKAATHRGATRAITRRVGQGAATAGKGAGRAVPWLALGLGLYGASTAGWFWTRARRYNQACYDLLKSRLTTD